MTTIAIPRVRSLWRQAPVWAALLGASACGAQVAAAPGASAPLLAYVQATRGNYELRLFNPAEQSSERLELSPQPPAVIVWRLDRPVVVTVGAAGAYAIRYRPRPVVSEPIGDPAPAGVSAKDGWIAADRKSLHVVGAAASAGAAQCALYDVPNEGRWRRLDTPAPQAAGDDADCERFADKHRPASGSASTAALLRAQACTAKSSACRTLGDPAYASARAALLQAARGTDAAAFADPGATLFFLGAGVATGDTAHLTAPVYLLRRAGPALVAPPLKTGKQVQIGLDGSWAVVAGEYAGSDPVVVDLAAGKTRFVAPGASGAVWVPHAGAAPAR